MPVSTTSSARRSRRTALAIGLLLGLTSVFTLAAPAGTLGIPSFDHTTRLAGGIPFFHPNQLLWVAVVAVLSALACLLSRQTVPVMTVHGPRGATRQSEARRLS